MHSSTDIRLNSVEVGLNEVQNKALGAPQNKAYAIYDDFHTAPEMPNSILYQQKYAVSRYTDES